MIPWKLLLIRLLVGCVVTLYGPYSILSSHPEPVPPLFSGLAVIGMALILVGLSVYLRCVWDFAFVSPEDDSNRLVTRGTYQFMRNPMYFGLVLILLGTSLLFKSWRLLGYAVVFWIGVHLLVILYEEQVLAEQFGATYGQYRHDVPRWIPKIHR
jgi:protein-S-isoprenylcysteine O-methyltransferase Ste14